MALFCIYNIPEQVGVQLANSVISFSSLLPLRTDIRKLYFILKQLDISYVCDFEGWYSLTCLARLGIIAQANYANLTPDFIRSFHPYSCTYYLLLKLLSLFI